MMNPTIGEAMSQACRKCGGFLIVERVLDYYGASTPLKCVNCGCRWNAQAALGRTRCVQVNQPCEGGAR